MEDVFKLPEVKIEIPKKYQMIQADAQMVETIDSLSGEHMVEFEVYPNDNKDFGFRMNNGKMMRVCDTITINGIQHLIFPGKNKLPASVYETYMNREFERQASPTPALNKITGEMRR